MYHYLPTSFSLDKCRLKISLSARISFSSDVRTCDKFLPSSSSIIINISLKPEKGDKSNANLETISHHCVLLQWFWSNYLLVSTVVHWNQKYSDQRPTFKLFSPLFCSCQRLSSKIHSNACFNYCTFQFSLEGHYLGAF